MNEQFKKPKTFSEILDQTFRLSKNHFADFFMILLLLIGPFYIIQAVVQLIAGDSLVRDLSGEGTWYEQMMQSLEQTDATSMNWGADIGLISVSILSGIGGILAEAAIILAINHIRKNETFTVGSTIKLAFSRFWPLLFSSILFFLIIIGLVIVPIIVISIGSVMVGTENLVAGILVGVILFLGAAAGIGYLITRFSFYFGSVTLKEGTPGFGRSWRLATKRTWISLGLFIVLGLISGCINMAIEIPLTAVLGNSILLGIIINVVALFTTMISSVGFAVMYFDLKIRHDADDLKDMLDEYKEN